MPKSTADVDLKSLFPGTEIRYGKGDDDVVTIRPLPMSELPEAIDVFAGIFEEMWGTGGDNPDADVPISNMIKAGKKVFRDIIKLLPVCLDKPLTELPTSITPQLIEAFVRQNVVDVWGNWEALADTIGLGKIFRNAAKNTASLKTSGGQS